MKLKSMQIIELENGVPFMVVDTMTFEDNDYAMLLAPSKEAEVAIVTETINKDGDVFVEVVKNDYLANKLFSTFKTRLKKVAENLESKLSLEDQKKLKELNAKNFNTDKK